MLPRPCFRSKATLLVFALLGALLGALPVAAAPRVVASIAPLHSLVAAVMKGVGTPDLLLRGGESPHTFALRPSDARLLNDADLLFWIGPSLELPVQRVLPGLRTKRALAMIDLPGIVRLPMRNLDHDHAAEAHTAQPGAIDPHIWLSVGNAITMVDAIAAALSEADPGGAATYAVNARDLRIGLETLDRELRERLMPLTGAYVVFHDAYQYLEQRYGLHPAGVVTTHPERSPGAAHLHELRRDLAARGVRCLFSEPQYQQRLVETISEGLPVQHAVLDPLGADIPPGPDAYVKVMRRIAETMSRCLGDMSP